MTKEEQIKEMVSIMAASNNPFIDVPIEIMPQVAKALYNAGYRKIPEDSVVLSREEWKQIKNSLYYSKEELEKKLQRERKETAKESYSKMYDFAYRTKSYYTDALNDIIAKIDETFNDFGIELESLLRKYYVEVEEWQERA